MEQVAFRAPRQPAAASAGRGSGGVMVALGSFDHLHQWRKLPDSIGLFVCAARSCQWFAVCPGCLGSLDAALAIRDGLLGMALYWCSLHQGGGAP